MGVGEFPFPAMPTLAGIRLSTASAGIRRAGRKDLVLMELAGGSTVAGVFTRNAFCGAPVTLCRQHLSQADIRYLLINSGNANACTGEQGMRDALACCAAVAGETRSEEHTSELQSRGHLVCRLLLEKKKDQQQGVERGGGGHGEHSAAGMVRHASERGE